MALTEAMEQEVDKRDDADTRMLLLAKEEFDKQKGGYKSESEEAEEEISEKECLPRRSASKKSKASTKLQNLKEKKRCLEVLNGAEAEKPETHFELEESNAENKVSEDPSPAAANKAGNSWTILKTASGWNKYADNGFVVHLKGSSLGPTLKWLRSSKKQWLE